MLHFFDRFPVYPLGKFLQALILAHLGVQEILVDRSQVVLERFVQKQTTAGHLNPVT